MGRVCNGYWTPVVARSRAGGPLWLDVFLYVAVLLRLAYPTTACDSAHSIHFKWYQAQIIVCGAISMNKATTSGTRRRMCDSGKRGKGTENYGKRDKLLGGRTGGRTDVLRQT